MSYDINLFTPVPGEDPVLTAQRDIDESESIQPLKPESVARNTRIASRLSELSAAFEIHTHESGTEFTWQRDNCAFQLFLGDSTGSLNMPYWSRNQDQEIFDLIASTLRVTHEETGFLAFDPQSDELIPVDGHSRISAQLFGFGVNAVASAAVAKPWWKFW